MCVYCLNLAEKPIIGCLKPNFIVTTCPLLSQRVLNELFFPVEMFNGLALLEPRP